MELGLPSVITPTPLLRQSVVGASSLAKRTAAPQAVKVRDRRERRSTVRLGDIDMVSIRAFVEEKRKLMIYISGLYYRVYT